VTEQFNAVVVEQVGDRAEAQLRRLALSDLPEGEVLVRVSHSSVNYKDALLLNGNRNKVARSLPMVPGIDLAGSVVSSASDRWIPGDQVMANGWGLGEVHWGGLSEYQRVSASWLQPLPEVFTAQQAMAIGTAGYTAALCVLDLETRGGLQRGDRVLVTGASGGVGSVSVALLAAAGYRVVASTGSTESHDYLKQLGAEEILDRSELAEEGRPLQKEEWQGAVDTVGGLTLANVLARTAYGRAVAACGLAGGAQLPGTVLPHIIRGVALLGVDSVMAPVRRRLAAWERLARDLDPRTVDEVSRTEPLERAVEVGQELLSGSVTGRIVISVSEEGR
jgi:putative YhdH/YhfP family quinone oxidoreductase